MSGGKLPVVSGKRVVQALTKAGFAIVSSAAIMFSLFPVIRREP
jgi:hypothetical protein